jgi:hypothetical protein
VKHIFQPMVLGCFGNNQLCEIPIQSNSIIKTMDLAMKHGDWPSTSINNYGEWGLKHGSLDIDFLPVIPSGKLTWLWKITIFNGKTHYKWPCSIAFCMFSKG